MQLLKTSFQKKGFLYEQVLREDSLAIYKQSLLMKDDDPIPLAYETIKIKSAPEHERGGVPFPAMELYPSENQFGLSGWSFGIFSDLSKAYERALLKFNELKQTIHGN
jgi:hypothetical protein